MRRMSRSRAWWGCMVLLGGLGVALAGGTPAAAQSMIAVSLVQQDASDCQNSNVSDDNGIKTSGVVYLSRNADGTTSVKVGMTVKANTTYHFFLKCVRLLGDIKTDDEGIGEGIFAFATNSVGNVFAFDMYPEGAPAGNKYQSVQVKFQ